MRQSERTQPLVVIVDDDPLMREGVGMALEGLCDTIGLASADGLEEFLTNTPADLLLLDVGLPGRDGFEVCRSLRAREEWRSLPVVMISARVDDASLAEYLATYGDSFLTKPFDGRTLLETVLRNLPDGPSS